MSGALLGWVGALWAAFLLPPELLNWAGADTPGWVQSVAQAPVYDAIATAGRALGLSDPYFVFGAGVAPAFLLIGLSLYRTVRRIGWSGRLLAVLTISGTVLTPVSYAASGWDGAWGSLWGIEGPLLMLIGVVGLVAGVAAIRQTTRRSWAWLLAATPVVVVMSTVAFGYYPHGTLIGLGVQAAALSHLSPARDAAAESPSNSAASVSPTA